MQKSLLLFLVLALSFNLVKAQDQDTVKITHINGFDLPNDTTEKVMLGTYFNVKATYTNPDSVTSITVNLVNSEDGWSGPWTSAKVEIDSVALDTINGMIDVMVPVPGNFPLYNMPDGKNTIQYVQVTVKYANETLNPYEFVQVTKESEEDKVVITKIGSYFFPDTTSAKTVDKENLLTVQAYYTNPESVESVQISLTSNTGWSSDWKSVAVNLEAPFTGVVDTTIAIPEDFPIYNYPEGKNDIQYVQVKVTYNGTGLVQPYKLIQITGEAVIVESIEDYLTSLTMTLNEDTTQVFNHSGWTFVGNLNPGDILHFEGTYEVERNGHKATSVNISILDFKGDWSGQNYSFGTIVASEAKNNLTGVIDHKIRIPHFFPDEFLVTEGATDVSNQMAQVRVTYDDTTNVPIDGGIYSNFWMDIFAADETPTTCMEVSGLELSDIGNNTVKLDWNLGNEAAWDILVAEAGTVRNPDASEDFVTVAVKPYVISGLKPGTDYELYIRTVCNNDTLNYQAGAYSEKITFSTTGTVGVNSLENSKLRLYPNPAKNTLRIDADDLYNIEVLDITGRVVLSKLMSGTNEELNISALNKGIYIINLKNKHKRLSSKFLKIN